MPDIYVDAGSVFEFTVDPGVNDDETQGYQSGHTWINTVTNHSFECTDASTGAAVWRKTTGAGEEIIDRILIDDITADVLADNVAGNVLIEPEQED